MVIFEQTLRNLLISTNLCEQRVFLMRAPQVPNDQAKVPYMVFFHVAPLPRTTQRGPLDLIERDYQVSVFDTSQTRALAIADSLRVALNTFHGTYENVYFGHCLYMLQTWGYEAETKLFQIIQEYRIMFRMPNDSAVKPAVTTAVQTHRSK